ncbi:MAG TPA: RDD family protein [Pyrinomonadaceae bacterium]|nr:RDD family protein [Pyrinomonadaceae bacterium]
MRCPSCGATYDGSSPACTDCLTETATEPTKLEIDVREDQTDEKSELVEAALQDGDSEKAKEWSSLIQFPGAPKSSVPQWRKELSERVREIQEQRAREAASAKTNTRRRERRNGARRAPQLALLESQAAPEINPIVAAALRRIGRAQKAAETETIPSPADHTRAPVASSRDIVPRGQAVPVVEVIPENAPVFAVEEAEAVVPEKRTASTEKIHNLIVVPPVVPKEPVKQEQLEPPAVVSKEPEKHERPARPKRIIADDPNHPALNYLDSIVNMIQPENTYRESASGLRRVLSAFVDLLVIGLFASPLLSGLYMVSTERRISVVVLTVILAVLLTGFLYLTIATALTGRTFGMRLLSLRVIDARTGLIPTGNQAAGRALIYLASLLSAGLALAYAVTDSEKRPAHDRLTGTAVVRV